MRLSSYSTLIITLNTDAWRLFCAFYMTTLSNCVFFTNLRVIFTFACFLKICVKKLNLRVFLCLRGCYYLPHKRSEEAERVKTSTVVASQLSGNRSTPWHVTIWVFANAIVLSIWTVAQSNKKIFFTHTLTTIISHVIHRLFVCLNPLATPIWCNILRLGYHN